MEHVGPAQPSSDDPVIALPAGTVSAAAPTPGGQLHETDDDPAAAAADEPRDDQHHQEEDDQEDTAVKDRARARIAVIGAGWWSQGRHLPHLYRNPDVEISAIVDPSDHPKSSLDPDLSSLDELSRRYGGCPTFRSVEELLGRCSDDGDGDGGGIEIDGAVVCTPHSTHYRIGAALLERGVPVFMEKPMTTSVAEALALHELASTAAATPTAIGGSPAHPPRIFLVNHSANYRPQAAVARRLVSEDRALGRVRHVSASMVCPLTDLFDDPMNVAWVSPTEGMAGNGFCWGQSCHLIGWIVYVCGDPLVPLRVFCAMNHSPRTGADVSFSATVVCEDGVNLSLSGTSLLPGYEHADPPVGKRISIEIYGDRGALVYGGDHLDPNSGRLEWRTASGTVYPCEGRGGGVGGGGFQFENTDTEGMGPESLLNFVDACLGREHYVGASSLVGLRTVQIVDAMYRSAVSGEVVDIQST